MKPSVSVIIPSYNHQKFIRETLDSVESQSYRGLEVIIIDDGSRDETVESISKWLRKNTEKSLHSYRFISQENSGAHATINRGIGLAKGEFVTILNSDDRYHQYRIEKLVKYMVGRKKGNNSDAIVLSSVRCIDDEGRNIPTDKALGPWYDFLIGQEKNLSMLSKVFSANIAVTTGNLFFSKNLFERVGPFRPLRLIHDYDFLLRCALIADIGFIDEPLLDYRVHKNNTVSKDKFEYGHEIYDLVYGVFSDWCLNLRHFDKNRAIALQKEMNAIPACHPCWLREWVGEDSLNRIFLNDPVSN